MTWLDRLTIGFILGCLYVELKRIRKSLKSIILTREDKE